MKSWYPVGEKEARTIRDLYLKGWTAKEIEKRTGRSRVSVVHVVNTMTRNGGMYASKRRQGVIAKIKYPGLAQWFLDSGASVEEAASVCGIGPSAMRDYLYENSPRLRGPNNDQIPKRVIDALIMWTGMTYEQMFYSPARVNLPEEEEAE